LENVQFFYVYDKKQQWILILIFISPSFLTFVIEI